MVSSSSSYSPLPQLDIVSEKLTRDNHILWKVQFLPVVHGAKLMGILDGSTPEPPKTVDVTTEGKTTTTNNLEHDAWVAKDQRLLSYLLNSLTKDSLDQVATVKTSGKA